MLGVRRTARIRSCVGAFGSADERSHQLRATGIVSRVSLSFAAEANGTRVKPEYGAVFISMNGQDQSDNCRHRRRLPPHSSDRRGDTDQLTRC